MNRQEIILAGLAPAGTSAYAPVQVQKLFFLIDKNVAQAVGGPHFKFEPYDYGPFDKSLYWELEALAATRLVEITPQSNWRTYRLTGQGLARGLALLGTLPLPIRQYIESVSEFVRKLSFTQLVAAIYKAYPEMRVNSVFQG
jgi:hypothetical protein